MTKTMMLSLLDRAKNGSQMLAILDSFSDDDYAADVAGGYIEAAQDADFVYMPTIGQNIPTLEEIAF